MPGLGSQEKWRTRRDLNTESPDSELMFPSFSFAGVR